MVYDMTPASEILKLIETVSPDDTGKLDEIDARVWCFLNSRAFKWTEGKRRFCFNLDYALSMPHPRKKLNQNELYTRSRDALKSIRPEGWTWVASTQDEGCHFNFYSPNPNHMRRLSRALASEFLPTEELAELHAIIQAIEHERGTAQ